MEPLRIPATERSPAVDFDFAAGVLSLKGESYPEDASAVFGPIFAALERLLASPDGLAIRFDLELAYFNSSSAKALMNMFQMLDDAAAAGASVAIHWIYADDDETMKEFGEDFSEDLAHVAFHLVATTQG